MDRAEIWQGRNKSRRRDLAHLWDNYGSRINELYDATKIVGNWRSSHSYPLFATRVTLASRAKSVDSDALIAHRLKRLPSIAAKLRRYNQMSLTQMQDIGGCRAVMKDTLKTAELIQRYRDYFKRSGTDYKEYDYLQNPKSDGYRSWHFVLKYRSRSEAKKVYDGLRIEIQIRTKVQHYWATAVETADMFTGQALKSNVGSDKWKRFFSLAGSALSLLEGGPPVPDTPSSEAEIGKELIVLAEDLKVSGVLEGFGHAVTAVIERSSHAAWFLLVSDSRNISFRASVVRPK